MRRWLYCCASMQPQQRWLMTSRRIGATDPPVIVQMKELLRGKDDVYSLAQGIVFWEPPQEAIVSATSSPDIHSYSPDEGIPELRNALRKKIADENGLTNSEVMVTAGANQAYANLVLALLDDGDKAALFRPYYFNHLMALQMTGCDPVLVDTTEDLLPDLQKLEDEMIRGGVRLVTVVNPGNPTGKMIPQETIEAVSELCLKYGAWLVADNTYDLFCYDEKCAHHCVEGDHVFNLFSFSKGYGAMGWRIGYLAFPPKVADELVKVQDTVVISAATISQRFALSALQDFGSDWVRERVAKLVEPQRVIRDALSDALGGPDAVKGGDGAIYLLATLPPRFADDDVTVAKRLIDEYKVAVIPGSACGAPGTIRVCYANLPLEKCREAAARLQRGLKKIVGA